MGWAEDIRGGWRCQEMQGVPLSGRPTVGTADRPSTTHEPQASIDKTWSHQKSFDR